MKIVNKQVTMTTEEAMTVAKDETLSKSKRIQTLFDAGYEVKDIHQMVGVIYNHAYNVISNYVIKNGIEIEKSIRSHGNNERKNQIKAMLADGMKIIDIQRELKCDYSQVWKVKKEMNPVVTAEEVQEAVEVIEAVAKKTKTTKGSK
jgi:transposase